MAVFLLAVPVALVGLLVALWRRVVVTVGVNEHAGVVEIARHTRRWRIVGCCSAAGGRPRPGARPAGRCPRPGHGARADRPGCGHPVGTIAGELSARPAVGLRRSAAVESERSARSARGRALVLAVSTALLVGALAIAAAWGATDHQGRAGRASAGSAPFSTSGSARSRWAPAAAPGRARLRDAPRRGPRRARGARRRRLYAIVNRPRRARQPWARHPATPLVRGQRAHRGDDDRTGHPRTRRDLHGVGLANDACGSRAVETLVAWTAALVVPRHGRGVRPAGLVLTPTIRVDDLPRPLPGDVAPGGRRCDDPVHGHGDSRPDPALRNSWPPARRPGRLGSAGSRRPAAPGVGGFTRPTSGSPPAP